MFVTTPRETFITLKDHKSDCATNPKVRLIKPTKPEVGRVAMQILDTMVKEIKKIFKFLLFDLSPSTPP